MSILTDAEEIRDETTTGANTATRVGGNLVAIAGNLTTKQTAIDANTAKVSFDSASSTRLANTSNTNTGDQDVSGLAPIDSPTFTGTVAGITKTMVGLANVPNTDFTAAVGLNTAKVSFDSASSTRLANTSNTNTGDQDLSGKQNALVAGANITIDVTNPLAPVISSAGGGATNTVNLTGNQTIAGLKTFSSPLAINGNLNLGGTNSQGINFSGFFGVAAISAGAGLVIANNQSGQPTSFDMGGVRVISITQANKTVLIGTTTENGLDKQQVNGPVSVTTLKTSSFTVATLPAPPLQGLGAIAHVTDALNPTYLGTLTGGGTVKCPVFYNGTNWVSS